MQLTQREFLFLEDVLAAERLGAVQFHEWAQRCSDPGLKALCQRLAQQQLNHVDRLLHLLSQGHGGQGRYDVHADYAGPQGFTGLSGSFIR